MLKAVLIASVLFVSLAVQARAVTIDTVPVGDVGNANDSIPGNAFGGVSYAYRIGTTEVTIGQYTAFLNAVAATDTYELYNTKMATDHTLGGIARSGSAGNYTYSAIGSPNKPVTYVNWGDAARFSNWLHNGQPAGPQGLSTTENGSYALNGAISGVQLNDISRSANATWVIPTENEWYKAAYFQPAAAGGDASSYWAYPTRTNVEPNSDQPPGDPAIQTNAANFFRDDGIANGYNGGFAVTGSTSVDFNQNYLTDVGSYTPSGGFYGTFDQGGNAPEWTEGLGDAVGFFRRIIRGGVAGNFSSSLKSSSRFDIDYSLDGASGFRVALVPEPSSLILGALGLVGFAAWGWRRRCES